MSSPSHFLSSSPRLTMLRERLNHTTDSNSLAIVSPAHQTSPLAFLLSPPLYEHQKKRDFTSLLESFEESPLPEQGSMIRSVSLTLSSSSFPYSFHPSISHQQIVPPNSPFSPSEILSTLIPMIFHQNQIVNDVEFDLDHMAMGTIMMADNDRVIPTHLYRFANENSVNSPVVSNDGNLCLRRRKQRDGIRNGDLDIPSPIVEVNTPALYSPSMSKEKNNENNSNSLLSMDMDFPAEQHQGELLAAQYEKEETVVVLLCPKSVSANDNVNLIALLDVNLHVIQTLERVISESFPSISMDILSDDLYDSNRVNYNDVVITINDTDNDHENDNATDQNDLTPSDNSSYFSQTQYEWGNHLNNNNNNTMNYNNINNNNNDDKKSISISNEVESLRRRLESYFKKCVPSQIHQNEDNHMENIQQSPHHHNNNNIHHNNKNNSRHNDHNTNFPYLQGEDLEEMLSTPMPSRQVSAKFEDTKINIKVNLNLNPLNEEQEEDDEDMNRHHHFNRLMMRDGEITAWNSKSILEHIALKTADNSVSTTPIEVLSPMVSPLPIPPRTLCIPSTPSSLSHNHFSTSAMSPLNQSDLSTLYSSSNSQYFEGNMKGHSPHPNPCVGDWDMRDCEMGNVGMFSPWLASLNENQA